MMDIGDDKELMAEFAEFKELLRRDAAEPRTPAKAAFDLAPPTAGADSGPSPQAPRAEEAWSAFHATEEEFLSEPEDEREGGRRGLFFAAAAIVIAGLAALTWVLGPWGGAGPGEDPALATAPPLAAPEASETALGDAGAQSRDAAPVEEAAKVPVLEENAKALAEPAPAAAAAAESAPPIEGQPEINAAGGAPSAAPIGASIPVPASSVAAPQLAPLPTAPAPSAAAPAKPAPSAPHAAAPAAPVSEPPPAAAETIDAPKPAPRVKVAKPKKPTKPIASRPKPVSEAPVAVAAPEPVAPPPPPPASDGPFSFVKRSVSAVGSAIGGLVR